MTISMTGKEVCCEESDMSVTSVTYDYEYSSTQGDDTERGEGEGSISTHAGRHGGGGSERSIYNDGDGEYTSRRNRRLEALKSGQMERRDQLQRSLSKVIMRGSSSSSLLCLEDHPYYLSQQERKLQALKQQRRAASSSTSQCGEESTVDSAGPAAVDHSSSSSSSSSSSLEHDEEPNAAPFTAEAMGDELLAAYQLMHRQRIRIQILEKKQQQDTLGEQSAAAVTALVKTGSPGESEEEQASSLIIRELQDQLVQLHHDRAEEVFHLRNRITHDAMRSEQRIGFLKTKAEYWQIRGQNASETHESEMKSAKERIQELEEAVALLSSTTKATKSDDSANPDPDEQFVGLLNDDSDQHVAPASVPSDETPISKVGASSLIEPAVYECMREELLRAYETIAMQKEQLEDRRNISEPVPVRPSTNSNVSTITTIAEQKQQKQLQERLWHHLDQLQREHASRELALHHRLTTNAEEYKKTIDHWKRETLCWKNRFDSSWEDHHAKIRKLKAEKDEWKKRYMIEMTSLNKKESSSGSGTGSEYMNIEEYQKTIDHWKRETACWKDRFHSSWEDHQAKIRKLQAEKENWKQRSIETEQRLARLQQQSSSSSCCSCCSAGTNSKKDTRTLELIQAKEEQRSDDDSNSKAATSTRSSECAARSSDGDHTKHGSFVDSSSSSSDHDADNSSSPSVSENQVPDHDPTDQQQCKPTDHASQEPSARGGALNEKVTHDNNNNNNNSSVSFFKTSIWGKGAGRFYGTKR